MFSSALYEGAQARGTTARKRAFRLTRLFGVEVKMLSPANLRAQIFPLADKAQLGELWDHQILKKVAGGSVLSQQLVRAQPQSASCPR